MSRAMILAAGFGTRLRPLTDEVPKPLVPLGDRPVLAHIADRLGRGSVSEIVVNTHHRHEHFAGAIDSLSRKIHLIHEVDIRGTAGGIAGARALLGAGPVIVWNGDVLAEPPILELATRAEEDGGLVLLVARRARGAGTVGLDETGRVVRLRCVGVGREDSGGDYVGIAALGSRALEALPARGCLVADVAIPALARGERIASVTLLGGWTDIGTVAAYHAANLDWLELVAGQSAAWVHARARVAPGVNVRDSVIGAGATLEGHGLVERVVIWPGAVVRAPLSNAVVTTAGQVVPVDR